MSKIKVKFPDSSTKEFDSGISCLDIVKSISNSLAKKVLVASYNNELLDLSSKLVNDGEIKFLTWDDDAGIKPYRTTGRLPFCKSNIANMK